MQKRREAAKARLLELPAAGGKSKSAVKKSSLASTDDITSAMTRLQQALQTTSDPEEQRRMVEQIQKLHNSYEALSGGDSAAGSEQTERLRAELQAQMASCSTDMDKVSEKEDAVRAQLDEIRQVQNASEPEIDALKAERDQCNEIVTALMDKVTEIRDSWQEQFATYKTQMDSWKVQMDTMWAEKCAPVLSPVTCLALVNTVHTIRAWQGFGSSTCAGA